MAPKRPAVEATSSSSSDEAASSSDEEHEEAPLSSPSPEKTTAQKKPTNPPAPPPQAPKPNTSQAPAAASSDEDDDDSEDEEESSASESDDDRTLKQPQPPPQPQPSVPKAAPQTTASGSSDGSGSGSDSEEESSDEEPAPVRRPSRGADPSIKPISSKPMDEAPQLNKPAAASPSLKKAKTTEHSENDGGVQKRPLFQRLWSPDDEITVLSGLVEYRSKKGTLPSSHEMDQLHNLIRGSLQVEVSNNQLNDKIRRMKKKFETNLGRGKNGADPSFSKTQERTVFELSKKIWGAKKIVSEDAGASSGEEDEGEESDSEMAGQQNVKEENAPSAAAALKLHDGVSPALPLANGSAKLRYPFLSGAITKMANECKCGAAMKRALENIEDPKARAMEEKVKKLKMGEMKLNIRRMDLMKETVKHIFEALAKTDL